MQKELESYWTISFIVMLPVCQVFPTGTRASLIIRQLTLPVGKRKPTGMNIMKLRSPSDTFLMACKAVFKMTRYY